MTDNDAIEWKPYEGLYADEMGLNTGNDRQNRCEITAALGVGYIAQLGCEKLPNAEVIVNSIAQGAIDNLQVTVGSSTQSIKQAVRQDVDYVLGRADSCPHRQLIDRMVEGGWVMRINLETDIESIIDGSNHMGPVDTSDILDVARRLAPFVENGLISSRFQAFVDNQIQKGYLPPTIRRASNDVRTKQLYNALLFMTVVSGLSFKENVGQPYISLDISKERMFYGFMGWQGDSVPTGRDVVFITGSGMLPTHRGDVVAQREGLFAAINDGGHRELWVYCRQGICNDALISLAQQWVATKKDAAIVVHNSVADSMQSAIHRFAPHDLFVVDGIAQLNDIALSGLPSNIKDAHRALEIYSYIHDARSKDHGYKVSTTGRMNQLMIPYVKTQINPMCVERDSYAM